MSILRLVCVPVNEIADSNYIERRKNPLRKTSIAQPGERLENSFHSVTGYFFSPSRFSRLVETM